MTGQAEIADRRSFNPWRLALWGTLAVLLALPAVAMRLGVEGVVWTASDFLLMGGLAVATGLMLELAVRMSRNRAARAAAGVAILAGFLTIWINLAVGMVGSEDNPYNLMFAIPLAVAVAGAFLNRHRPAGMAGAMFAAAIVEAAVGLVGLGEDPRGGFLSGGFALFWLLSAWLFRKAARNGEKAV